MMKRILFMLLLISSIVAYSGYSNNGGGSWQDCRNATIWKPANDTNGTNEAMPLNFTGLTISSTDEIRVADTFCGNGGNEIHYEVYDTDDSTWAVLVINATKAEGSNLTYSVYYNNPSATAPSYSPTFNWTLATHYGANTTYEVETWCKDDAGLITRAYDIVDDNLWGKQNAPGTFSGDNAIRSYSDGEENAPPINCSITGLTDGDWYMVFAGVFAAYEVEGDFPYGTAYMNITGVGAATDYYPFRTLQVGRYASTNITLMVDDDDQDTTRAIFDSFKLAKAYVAEVVMGDQEEDISQSPIVNITTATFTTYDTTPAITFYFTDSDDTTASCDLFANSTLVGMNATTLNGTTTSITSNTSLAEDTWQFNVTCNDGSTQDDAIVSGMIVWTNENGQTFSNISYEGLNNFTINVSYSSDVYGAVRPVLTYENANYSPQWISNVTTGSQNVVTATAQIYDILRTNATNRTWNWTANYIFSNGTEISEQSTNRQINLTFGYFPINSSSSHDVIETQPFTVYGLYSEIDDVPNHVDIWFNGTNYTGTSYNSSSYSATAYAPHYNATLSPVVAYRFNKTYSSTILMPNAWTKSGGTWANIHKAVDGDMNTNAQTLSNADIYVYENYTVPLNTTNMTVYWKISASQNRMISIFNYTSGLWDKLAHYNTTASYGWTDDGSIFNTSTSAASDYISSGKVWLRTYTNSSATYYYGTMLEFTTMDADSRNATGSPINVWLFNVTTCGATPTVNISHWHEQTDNIMFNATTNGHFTYWTYNSSYTKEHNMTNSTTPIALCLAPGFGTTYVSAEIEYFNTTLISPRYHYLINSTVVNNATSNIRLYMLEDTKSTAITFHVRDASNNDMENIIVKALRKDFDTNTYRGVAMCKTDTQGYCVMRLEQIDATYQFLLEQGGVVLETISDKQLSGTEEEFVVSTIAFTWYYDSLGVTSLCTTTEVAANTTSVNCTYTDTSNFVQDIRLIVRRYNTFGTPTTIYNQTVTGYSGSISTIASGAYQFDYYLIGEYTQGNRALASGTFSHSSVTDSTYIYAMMLILGTTLLFVYNSELALGVFAVTTLFVGIYLEMYSMLTIGGICSFIALMMMIRGRQK